jgi:PAS domain S-box-containing protein
MSEPANILIVDDELRSRDFLTRGLSARGLHVESCQSAVECFGAIEKTVPDLILLDVCMPQMSGLEVLGQLRKSWNADLLPVILVSGVDDSEGIVAGFDAGANDYVVKPINLPVLLARIDTCLRIKTLAQNSARTKELLQANAALAAEIAERKRVEQALRLSEERFEKTFRASPDGVTLSYRDSGQIIDANDSFSRMFGFALEEVIGKSSLELGLIAHPPDRERAIAQLRATGKIRDFEAPGRRRNGEIFPVAVTAESLEIHGAPCILTIVRDNTERERSRKTLALANEELERRVAERTTDLRDANEALRESEERFRTMANNAPVLLWMTGEDGLCSFVNRSWTDFTGRPLEQEVGLGWSEGLHSDDRERCVSLWRSAFDQRKPFIQDYRIRRADGEYRWLYGTGVPRFTRDGGFAGYIGSCIDVTERREAEQFLRETADELERRVRERTAELAETNVQLREEVAERRAANHRLLAYQSKLRALAAQVAIAEERERRRIARGLHDEIGQSLALVKMRLGSFSEMAVDPDKAKNLEEIRSALETAIVHIRSLTFELGSRILYDFGLETAVENLAEEMHKHGIEPFFSDDRLPKPLDEDIRVIVFQAVRELLHNVAKHSGAKHVSVSISGDGPNVRVEVRDDGIGYDAQKAGHAFSSSGGFGLFNLREQLDFVGARVEVQSTPGEGTRTTIYAPLKRSAAAEANNVTLQARD